MRKGQLKNIGDGLPLGKMPDSLVAENFGIDRRTVCYMRNRAGIPKFSGFLLTQEGDPCHSVFEAKYDAYLHWQNIEHSHQVKIPNMPYIADFLLASGSYVEIVGMLDFEKYAVKSKAKWFAYDAAGIPCQWFEPGSVNYLYSSCPIAVKVSDLRICTDCGTQTHDLIKGLCRHKCYMKKWRQDQEVGLCKTCEQKYPKSNKNSKYCSRACYWKSLKLEFPSLSCLYTRRFRERKKKIR